MCSSFVIHSQMVPKTSEYRKTRLSHQLDMMACCGFDRKDQPGISLSSKFRIRQPFFLDIWASKLA